MVFREVDRNEVIAGLSKYFNIQELVCPHTYERFGEASWQFLNTYMLAWLLLMRTEIFKAPMYINTKSQTQRGLRCIMCDIVKNKKAVYLSGHVLAEAEHVRLIVIYKFYEVSHALTHIKVLRNYPAAQYAQLLHP